MACGRYRPPVVDGLSLGQWTTAESPDHLTTWMSMQRPPLHPRFSTAARHGSAGTGRRCPSPAPTRTTHRAAFNRPTWNTKTWKPALAAAGVITPSRAWGGGRSPVVSGRPAVSMVSTPSPHLRVGHARGRRVDRHADELAEPLRPGLRPANPVLTSCRRRARVGLRPSTPGSAVRRKLSGKSPWDPSIIGSAGTGAVLGSGLLGGGGGRIGSGAVGPLGGSRWRGSCSRTSNERTGAGRSLIAAEFASGNPPCAEV